MQITMKASCMEDDYGGDLEEMAMSGDDPRAALFPHPYPAVDLVLFRVRGSTLDVLVLRRATSEPRGWALPGAYVQIEETVEETAARIFRDKLAVPPVPAFFPLRPFSRVDRDPRRRVISLPQLSFLAGPSAGDVLSDDLAWAQLSSTRPPGASVDGDKTQLVFDHQDIVEEAVEMLRRRTRLDDPDLSRAVLPSEFTLRRLQEVHEALLGEQVNRDSFRRRVLASGRIEDTGRREEDVEHRPARLFRWTEVR
jgi:8-oxo-dGTP diphosphatase